MTKVRALNIGGWLVLEKWMTPSLFEGTSAEDEYNLLLAREDARFDIIKKHRDTFITKEDFKWIAEYGIDTVRLPVGHWVLEAKAPYIEAISYVDNAFEWASEYDLKVMLDMHAAPGCQNGFDNGGLSGICEWHTKQAYIDKTVDVLEQLAIRYKDHEALGGIEVLNEPRWDVPRDILEKFYLESYTRLRAILSTTHYIVFHDGFRFDSWKEFFMKHSFDNVFLDTHMYQVFSDKDKKRSMAEVIEKVSIKRVKELKEVSDYIPVIVGEWSLGLPHKAKSEANDSFTLDALYRAVGNSLLVSFEQVSGWVFWNYKLASDSHGHQSGWSFRYAVETGWLPKAIESKEKLVK